MLRNKLEQRGSVVLRRSGLEKNEARTVAERGSQEPNLADRDFP
jgi:hypothetical protein